MKNAAMIIALALAAALMLAGCKNGPVRDITDAFSFGSKESTEEESTTEETASAETETETETEAPETTTKKEETEEESNSSSGSGPDSETDYIGAAYSCEAFQAVCPEGWVNYPLMDFWDKEKPDDKNLQFYKGELESEFDAYYHAGVRLTCYSNSTTLLDSSDYYENIEEEAVTDLEGRKWEGFTGDYGSSRNFYLMTETDENYFVATGLLNGKKSEFKLSDEDFLTILSSIRANSESEESSAEESTEEESTTEEASSTASGNETESPSKEETSTEKETETSTEKEAETSTEKETETSTEKESSAEASSGAASYKASENVSVEYGEGHKSLQVSFEVLPQSVEDLEACIEEFGHNEKLTAAWFIAAMHAYTIDPKEGEKMIGFLCDPDEARSVTSFVTDQLRQKKYLGTAYFTGAARDNNFTPDEPWQITLTDYESSESNKFIYVRVACGSDSRDRTIALVEDDVVGYRVIKCPALLLGIN